MSTRTLLPNTESTILSSLLFVFFPAQYIDITVRERKMNQIVC
jgi:hypothetical protein